MLKGLGASKIGHFHRVQRRALPDVRIGISLVSYPREPVGDAGIPVRRSLEPLRSLRSEKIVAVAIPYLAHAGADGGCHDQVP